MRTTPTVSLFVPCLVEHFRPEIGEAAARVLNRAGVRVECPSGQTCCGQPLYKAGHFNRTRDLAHRFLQVFQGPHPVVAPSGSCVAMVRKYPELLSGEPDLRARAEDLAGRTFELCEYLVRVQGVTDLGSSWSGAVVYHDSCQVGRALGLHEEPRTLLRAVRGLELREPSRPEMCCGFGGTFSIQFPETSEALTREKVQDLAATGADTMVTAEVSCLMNLDLFAAKQGLKLKCLHIAQVLARYGDRS